ncbi:class I SAM-dependent methyltransferase [Rhizobium beringeri]|jgi:SAM-dependent methyltransferase|uniref:class I SAM-dependent methyltransferase n=1 Tax=Rhizobium beringeri TaxID=3019934 RepID=UPI003CEE3301
MRASSSTNQEMPTGADTYSSAMSDANNYMGWILDAIAPAVKAPVLEIGVGHGSYTEQLRTRGEYVGVDIDQASVDLAKRLYPELRFHVADITQSEFVDDVGAESVNSVVCLNVIEHIPDDRLAVANLARVLKSGGNLAIVVPALNLLFNDLDRLAGHLRRYRTQEVRQLLVAAGLTPVRVNYFNPIGGLGWLANRLVRHQSLNDAAVNGQIRAFDRWVVPASRAVDPITRGFFGQSVIAIGRKP